MFRNIRLPRSGLVDISRGGAFTCHNCHFSNVSTDRGIVETGNNVDYASYLYSYDYGRDVYREDPDDHDRYDIFLDAAPYEAVLAYGSDYVVDNETIRDCVYLQRRAGDHALSNCPQEAVAERRARRASASRRDEAYADPGRAHEYTTQDYTQQERDRDWHGRTPDQYYDDSSQILWLEDDASAYAPSPLDMSYADRFLASLGEQLSIHHPWLQAIMKVRFNNTASVCVDVENRLHRCLC